MEHLLKLAILKRRKPQYELAELARINETRFSRIVQGRVDPTNEERARIAEALGVPEADLFPAEDEPARSERTAASPPAARRSATVPNALSRRAGVKPLRRGA